MEIVWIILLVINILIYGICCFLILRKKHFTCISIRSPRLLILNNIGNLLMTIIIIITASLDYDARKYCSLFYYITNFLMIIPLCLRFRRIAKCCELNIDERLEIKDNTETRNKFQEKYNIRIMLIILIILTVILVIANAILSFDESITPSFLYSSLNASVNDANNFIWLAINFVEHILLLTYTYHIFVNKLKQKLRFEILSCFIIWFVYSNLICLLEITGAVINRDVFIYISLVVCYLFLIINSIIPIIMTKSYKNSTIYTFFPKLMNNIYLFLSNETCYSKFKDYLGRMNGNGNDILRLYIYIMEYKLGYKLKVSNEDGFIEALRIKNEFFGANNSAHLPEDVLEKVKKECKGLENNNFNEEMFDEALKYCYSELEKIFGEYKKSEDFKILYKEYFVTTYIHCKMSNVGLINKF